MIVNRRRSGETWSRAIFFAGAFSATILGLVDICLPLGFPERKPFLAYEGSLRRSQEFSALAAHLRFHAQSAVSFWKLAYVATETSQGFAVPALRTGSDTRRRS